MSVESPPPAVRLPHLPSVQVLRGFATLGVLLAHLYVVEGKYSPDRLLGRLSDLGHWGVDIFFVISGFIMVYVTWGTRRGWAGLPDYLWRRASRIYPLYWVISLAVLAVWLWRPDLVFQTNDPDIVRSFALYPQANAPLLAVGWTLVHEVYFYLVWGLILVAPRRWTLPILGLWAAMVVAAGFAPSPDAPTLRLALSPLTLEFIAGALFGLWYAGADPAARHRPGIAALCFAGAAALVAMVGLTQSDLIAYAGDWWPRVAVYGTAAWLAFAGLLLSGWSVGRVAQWLGDISYSLYLTHVLTLTMVARLAQPYLTDGPLDNGLLIAAMAGAALAVGHITYLVVERPLIRLFRRRRTPLAHPSRSPSASAAR